MAWVTRSCAVADWMAESSACSWALADSTWAMAESWPAWDESRSLRAMSLRANSSVLRSKSRLASTTATCAFAVWAFASASAARAFSTSARARSIWASWLSTVARDDSRSAFAWLTFARKMSGSIRAMIWFFHDRVEVDHELFDLTGHLAADLDRDDGVEIARRRDGRGEGPPLDAGHAVLGHAATALGVEVAPDGTTDQHGDDDEGNDPLHQLVRRGRGRTVSSGSAATDSTIQPRESDPVVGQGLALGVLGLGEGELGVGELEDRP